jgi:nitrite reductase/ring-hydroxylating ferredoxin subunit
MFRRFLPVFLLIGALIASCDKAQAPVIPEVPVYLVIYPNDPIYFDVQTVGGWMYIGGGFRGILLYRVSVDQFAAYERACPGAPEADCGQIQVDLSSNITAYCPCDSTSYLLLDGSQVSGPGPGRPLKAYGTDWDGNRLTIFN